MKNKGNVFINSEDLCQGKTARIIYNGPLSKVGDEILTFEPEELKNFLSQLETYASQCYIQTKKHFL